MSDNIYAAIIGAIADGIIVICATYFGNRLAESTSLKAIQISEFNKAAAIFRFEQYSGHEFTKAREFALSNIEKLLKFAKPC